MKVLQIISGRTINGALVYCKLLSNQLRSLDHDVTVLTRDDSWLAQTLIDSDVPFLTSSLNRFPLSELKRVARWISENEIDVVHTHMSRGHSFGVMLKMFTDVPIVATAHSRSFQLHWRMNDFVIANSQSTAAYQNRVNKIPDAKLATVHCFVDLEKFVDIPPIAVRRVRRQLRLNGDEFVIGIVGDVVARKGHLYLFRALRKLAKAVPNFKLVLLGRFHRQESYTKQLRSILVKEKLFRHTKWLGLRFNIQDFMAAFDVCVVPSLEEPLGMVAIESLAANTPVVSTNVGGLPEIVQHEKNGLLVDDRDPEALGDALIRLANQPELRKQFGEAGRKMVFERFDPARLTNEVVSVYKQVVKAAA